MLQRVAESIWVHEQRISFSGLPMWHRMSIIRLESGAVVLHSPTRIDSGLAAPIAEIGHDLYLRETLQAFPNAALNTAPQLRANGLPIELQHDMEQCTIEGIGLFLNEVVFYHRPSRSLIVADLLLNFGENDAPITRLLAPIIVGRGCTFARLYRPFVFDPERFRASIERIRRWDFTRIIVGHGAIVDHNAAEVFAEAFGWL